MKSLFYRLPAILAIFLSSYSFSNIENYSFNGSSSTSSFNFPGLYLSGEVNGKLNIKRNSPLDFSANGSNMDILKLSLEFDTAPDLTATNFSFNPQTNSYIAKVSNAWVFSSVNVEILNIDTQQQNFNYRVSIETLNSLTDKNISAHNGEDIALLEGIGFLQNKTPFKLVDMVNVNIDGKRLSIKLNGNKGSNNNPEAGMVDQGFELKLLWFGRGEKLMYVPAPESPYTIKPIAIILEPFNIGGEAEYEFYIKFEENGNIFETPREVLTPRLERLFQQ